MRDEFDYIVIGAGLSGLSTACLLVQKKKSVLLLEAHSSVGGCASSFGRKKFLFDAGATTLSGMGNQQPVQRLLRTLHLDVPVRLCDPGMIIHTGRLTLHRWIDQDRWIAECESAFGPHQQRSWWTLVREVAERGWNASRDLASMPLQSVTDIVALPAALRHIALGPSLFRSVGDVVRELGLYSNKPFVQFLNEQLIITTQSGVDDTPFAVGAMGLNYPADTWYVQGGMNNFARLLQKYFLANGGTLLLKKKVHTVTAGRVCRVVTDDRRTYGARNVISSATGWNNREIFPEQKEYFEKAYSSLAGWGAFTLYAGVRNSFDDRRALYHQIIPGKPIPFAGSNSIFLSFSPANDSSRQPDGFRTLTVSTHIANPHHWWSISKEDQAERKKVMTGSILDAIGAVLPGFTESEKPVLMTGTPVTFEHFTHRRFGQVGGIPHSMHRPVFAWQGWRTQQKGIYLVGDTVYPGQGAPGVILGALNLVAHLT